MTSQDSRLLMEPDLHDGKLTGILLNGERTVELYCADVMGKKYILRLERLIAFRADSFREGNIIFEVLVHSEDYPRELVKRAFGHDAAGDPPWLESRLQKLTTDRATLVELTSSYGCEL